MTFKVNGKRIYESTKTTNKKLAQRIYTKRASEIAEGKWFLTEARKRTFEELRNRYMEEHSKINKAPKSHSRDKSSFRHLSTAFCGLTLAEITPARISEYKSLRRIEGAKPATLSRELEVLRHALNLAVREWEWLDRNPFERVKTARLIHYVSDRIEKPFVAINCAGLPETLIESELFGHKKGSYTGATRDKQGFFEVASDGTIFLDEIGDMPIEAQAKLLRVLENGEFYAVGSTDIFLYH